MAKPLSRSAATTAREVKVVFSRLRRRIRGLALIDDLSGSQAAVLTRLHKEGPSSTSVLASAEAVSHQAIGAILAVLEERGFIHRSPDPTDGRRQLISLTDAGVAQAENTTSAREEWLARALQDRLTEDERRAVRHAMALLNRLAESDSATTD
jgi:DNA-binding MarR family transcriptional regulator